MLPLAADILKKACRLVQQISENSKCSVLTKLRGMFVIYLSTGFMLRSAVESSVNCFEVLLKSCVKCLEVPSRILLSALKMLRSDFKSSVKLLDVILKAC